MKKPEIKRIFQNLTEKKKGTLVNNRGTADVFPAALILMKMTYINLQVGVKKASTWRANVRGFPKKKFPIKNAMISARNNLY